MALILKQSTAADVLIGPFLDDADGSTAEEGESPSVLLSKNGQTLAAKNDVTTPVHDDAGYYNCELDATDTNTVGTLALIVEASANALPVRHEFQVVEEAVYDAFFGASAGMAVTLATGAITAAVIATDAIDADAIAADVTAEIQTGLATADDIADAVWNEATTGHTTAGTFGAQAKTVLDGVDTVVDSILADTGTDGVVVQSLTAAALADFFNTDSGTDYASAVAGSVVKETADNAGGSALTVADIADAVWDEDATGHQTGGTFGQAIGDPGANTETIYEAVVADAAGANIAADIIAVKAETADILVDTGTTLQGELDAIQAAVITNAAGTDIAADIIAIKAETAAILADTDDIGVAGAGLTALASAANLATVAGFLDTEIAAILADTDELQQDDIPGLIAALDILVDAIKAKTDSLTFTVAGKTDSNITHVNEVEVAGDGDGTPWGPV
jgi:hypothetical protein